MTKKDAYQSRKDGLHVLPQDRAGRLESKRFQPGARADVERVVEHDAAPVRGSEGQPPVRVDLLDLLHDALGAGAHRPDVKVRLLLETDGELHADQGRQVLRRDDGGEVRVTFGLVNARVWSEPRLKHRSVFCS